MNMDAGQYRHRVVIQRVKSTATPDASGHVDKTLTSNWENFATIHVGFTTKGGKEGRVFDQVQAEVGLIAQTRSNPTTRAINPTMRMMYGGRQYNIAAAYDVDQLKKVVRLELIEVV